MYIMCTLMIQSIITLASSMALSHHTWIYSLPVSWCSVANTMCTALYVNRLHI